MRKKIAIFTTGRGGEILCHYLDGVKKGLDEISADAFVFVCFTLQSETDSYIKGEMNIFKLPDLRDFDGALIVGNLIDYEDIFEQIVDACKEAGIPVVCNGRDNPYCHKISVDNYNGMVAACEHLKNVHGVEKVFFIAGSKDNNDSNERFEAVRNIFPQTTPNDVFYTDWDVLRGVDFVKEWIDSGKALPDAFMCANDGLAQFIVDALMEKGISIPGDMKIFGFDDLSYAPIATPSLSSVNQNFNGLGYGAITTLSKCMNKENISEDTAVPCLIKCRESCGCGCAEEADIARQKVIRMMYIAKLEQNVFDEKLNMLDAGLLSGHTFSDIFSRLTEIYTGDNSFEKGNIQILLEPNYEKANEYTEIKLPIGGYSDNMVNIFSMRDGHVFNRPMFERRRLIPGYEENDEQCHIYLFMPLHEDEKTIGYYILKDVHFEIEHNDALIKYHKRLNSIFVKYRQNLYNNYLYRELKKVNETDPLTSVKNRSAYEDAANDMDDRIIVGANGPFAIGVFDVNNLKRINDSYGHEKGDEYIKNSSKLLCRIFKHSPVFRIGGDEFLIILEGSDYRERESLLEKLQLEMDDSSCNSVESCTNLSIAYGMSVFNKSTDKTLAEVFKRADALMYEKKKEMKEKMKNI